MQTEARAFPFPLPNGWFAVAYSREVAPGQVVPLRYFGTDLLLYRSESGAARVLDAFCPHLGANIGRGGKVEGDTIRCPFHGWRFGADGACVEVPYAQRIPPKARLGAWPLCERNGAIWVWRHAEGKPPEWDVPLIPEFSNPGWTEPDVYRWRVRTYNQEMGENAVDKAHFRYVHGTMQVPESEVTVEGPWRRSLNRSQMLTPRGPVDGCIDANSYGFGCGFTRFTGICETVLLAMTTPIDLGTCDVRFAFTQQKENGQKPVGGVGAAIIRDIVKQLNEDIPIWENKQYVARPVLCDGDGPIAEFRRWSLQFYSL
jgi:phenylpropionate dioxygenase-like ring-hydroxylating dioxygenase large terminal subunit